MDITLESDNGQRHYHIDLERHEFDDLYADCPGISALVGLEKKGGTFFYIYPGHRMSKSFKQTPERDGYYAYVGAEVPRLPPHPTNEEFEKLSQEAYNNLEKAINRATIPITTYDEKINLGYVTIGVKK
ncbi:hypothetical protein KY312_00480 [Candidatus Woesearchaeota archaeon]|nr:hypothetical protein [Candidatus Woesearchaeota archaeon]